MAPARPRFPVLLLLPWILTAAGCYDYDDDDEFVDNAPSTVASDFQSIADYVNHPVVRALFRGMPRNQGDSPPDVAGSFSSSGFVTSTTIPGGARGEPVSSDFCFGTPAGSALEVIVQDPSVIDGGAASFVEGSGDRFTVYTAFKSTQTQDRGGTCEIHEVNVFSGVRNADGSLSDLRIGFGIVGLVGDCFPLLVGDVQRSDNTADFVGPPCGSPGQAGPDDPRNALVVVENNLAVDVLVFLGSETEPALQVAALSIDSFETRPGFALAFESIQPSAGTDPQGNELLMGEIIAGEFSADSTPAGGTVTYSIENQVGNDIYFAPLPLNQTSREIFAVTNQGVNIPGYPPPPGSGLDCQCLMPPSPDPYVIGYYSYSVPGVIQANQANVRFFDAATSSEIVAFQGPFNLEPLTGAVTLAVR